MRRKKSTTSVIIFIAIAAIVGLILAGRFDVAGVMGSLSGPLTYDEALVKLDKNLENVRWREDIVDRVQTVSIEKTELEDTLPAISTFPIVADGRGGNVVAEIFVSTEKSGEGTDGWMAQAAAEFNRAGRKLKNGKSARVTIRKIASGTGYQFIAAGKYRPAGYSPSNHLWIRMAQARGVAMTPVREKTVGNIAGIVMKRDKVEAFREDGGGISVPELIDAVVQRKLVTGYTNPYASSTGLNFLVTVLSTFAQGKEAEMLSPAVISAFESFQGGIPFVALTTLQMRDSVSQDGSLDAFVMEYQTYIKADELVDDYEFIPFGIRHDNPLYALDEAGPEKKEALELFGAFLEETKYKNLADDYGFNPKISYDPAFDVPGGETLIAAQRLWKEKKNAGRPVVAVFVSDVSGSMDGGRLSQLKRALIQGSNFISKENSIGLVEFNDEVRVVLPIKPFQLLHRSAYHAAVTQMRAGGGTAMYDGIAVGLSMLAEALQDNPGAKPILFVLTDGKTNEGMSYGDMSRVVSGLKVPIYTIGFEANLEELSRVSGLVEAASINAGEKDLGYKIGSLLNTQL